MLISLPMMEQSIALNEALIPAGGWIETNLKPFQELADKLTIIMLTSGENPSLLFNIILFALVPAICEEFAFRGVIQSQIVKMFGNVHLGIWVSAIVFSAIHMQFYGFIPRMLLGAVFGYLVIYSGSIWAAVLAHFVNNSLAVLSVHVYGNLDLPEESLEASMSNLPMGLLSATLVMTGLFFLYKKGNWNAIRSSYMLDESTH
jgi:membrane protease YdiL (CAAX protease family)